VQVDPIKPVLKAPGIKGLILNYGEPLSNFAFKFNLRRYIQDFDAAFEGFVKTTNRDHMKKGLTAFDPKVSRCNLKHVETRVESGRSKI
jgi:hypothetical protein